MEIYVFHLNNFKSQESLNFEAKIHHESISILFVVSLSLNEIREIKFRENSFDIFSTLMSRH